MDENLLEYLLNSLDPDATRQVEEYLLTHPDAAVKLERLRQTLAPLAADAEAPEPPPHLVVNTLALVAEYQCRPPLPPAPKPKPRERGSSDRHWLRRADVLVAASLLIVFAGFVVAWLLQARQHEQRLACQNNLRKWWLALEKYSDAPANQGGFPRVETEGARSVAGVYVPLLNDAHLITPDMSVGCPGMGFQAAPDYSARQLDWLYRKDPISFEQLAPSLSTGYAYSLGYVAGGKLEGLQRTSSPLLPILADRPPNDSIGPSINHGGQGQNVLYIGGNVRWCSSRTVGVGGDDIFLNQRGQVLPGLSINDTVSAPSEATPYERHCHWQTPE